MSDNPIEVGGAYSESEDFVPNPADLSGQFNTSGTGAHGDVTAVSPIYDIDKVKTAQEIVAALDPENDNVSEDRVLLPDPLGDNEQARESILAKAEARIEKGVVIGGPNDAEAEAALEGEEGEDAAIQQERSNSQANSTGHVDSGKHDDGAGTSGVPSGSDSSDDSDDDSAPAKSASKGDWVDYAVKQGASKEDAEASTKDELVDKYGA